MGILAVADTQLLPLVGGERSTTVMVTLACFLYDVVEV